ncbi:MAG: GTP 3',8-cyclase MoaA [Chloroflexota bacterium]|nr:GTP 3',8-cyclase MoaA [Chloroflexota bacterium]
MTTPSGLVSPPDPVASDARGRPLRDLRISVTDRCNFRCTYCMPRDVYGTAFRFLPHADLLTFEEVTRLAGVAISLGVAKVRLTGGEPLLRRDVEHLVGMLADLDGLRDLTLTTNGSLLATKAADLAAAGLNRVTVSLDSLDDAVFARLSDVDFPVARVLEGIDAADRVGLRPIKVNMVVRRGLNENSVLPMARFARERGYTLRFIEYMDVGHTNGWELEEVVPSSEVVAAIDAELPLEALEPQYPGEVAARWRYRDGIAEIGVISSVTQPFCGACTRARLTAEGVLYTCLFGTHGVDLRAPLREGVDDAALRARLSEVWSRRTDRYSELRSGATAGSSRVEMSRIGG